MRYLYHTNILSSCQLHNIQLVLWWTGQYGYAMRAVGGRSGGGWLFGRLFDDKR